MCLKMAHSTGERASASREAAAAREGTQTSHTWAAECGMKGMGSAQKNARIVAATSSAVCVLRDLHWIFNQTQPPHIWYKAIGR